MRTPLSAMTLLMAATLVSTTHAEPTPIRYQSFRVGNVTYHAVIADLRSPRVEVETYASKGLTRPTTLIKNSHATVAMTGTFFNPGDGVPIADVLVDGNLKNLGGRGSVLGVDWFGNVSVFDTGLNENVNWFDYRYALRGGVRLLRNGVVSPDPASQSFRDRAIWRENPRTGAGVTQSGDFVMVATSASVSLTQFGYAMKKLGVYNGVSFDGGSSTCLYYRNNYVIRPGRSLSNIVVLRELSPTDGEWASYTVPRRHVAPVSHLMTSPSKWNSTSPAVNTSKVPPTNSTGTR